MRTKEFAEWLAAQSPAGILPTQVGAVVNILDRVSIGDLVMVMLEGGDELTLKAWTELRRRFQSHEYWGEQMMTARSLEAYDEAGH